MLEPPALAEDALVGALETGFGIRVGGLVFLPLGNDTASWAYRVEVAGGRSLFLKVRAGASSSPAWRPRSPRPTRPTRPRARWPGSGRLAGT